MKYWKKPTSELLEKALASVRKETDRRYFFSRLKNPMWLEPLLERGYFRSPPSSNRLPDGSIQFPHWPELEYLANVSPHLPEEVTKVVLELPAVDNPRVYEQIIDIALQLPGDLSGQLIPKMLEYARLKYRFWAHRYIDLMVYWLSEDQVAATLELAEHIVRFEPDADLAGKRNRHLRNPRDWTTILNPSPRFDEWDYKSILEEGIRPLTDKSPFEVACLLINVVAEMILLSIHQDENEHYGEEDGSEIWCRRLGGQSVRDKQPNEAVVSSLTYACEQVFERAPDLVEALNASLREQRWKVFKRIRQHLYALHPNRQTHPWIRELILGHKDHGQWTYHFEFQLMVRRACEHFGEHLLAQEERELIFDAILSGPSKPLYKEWTGEQFNEELYEEYKRNFHAKQLRPYKQVLFGHYTTYFQRLEEEVTVNLVDEDYSPVSETQSGVVSLRSPQSPQELAERSDEELLDYINEWEAEHRDAENWLVEIKIEALVEAFQVVFRDCVLPDPARLQFWLENRDRVQRPIYVKAMTKEMQYYIKGGNLNRLHETLYFCEWVISHPDQEPLRGYEIGEKSRVNPNWNSSRRAVGDLVEVCLSEDVNLPSSAKVMLGNLLEKLCTEFDWRLDGAIELLADRGDQFAEAINNTRSLALRSLILFGLWMRRIDPQSDISLVMDILEKRFSTQAEFPLALPEYAVLGVHFGHMYFLDDGWTTRHLDNFFPRHSLPEWRASFGSHLRYTSPNTLTFEVLEANLSLAIGTLFDIEQSDPWGEKLEFILGRHLFIYYIWGLVPLSGVDSLLKRFYLKSSGNLQLAPDLFKRVGYELQDTGDPLEKGPTDRLLSFFEWRLDNGNPTELAGFDRWLVANCLDLEWRLNAYSRILDVGKPEGWEIYGHVEALHRLLPEDNARVMECFAKLTDGIKEEAFHISTDLAADIIRTGIESPDGGVRQNAERARESLLRRGFFGLLDLTT